LFSGVGLSIFFDELQRLQKLLAVYLRCVAVVVAVAAAAVVAAAVVVVAVAVVVADVRFPRASSRKDGASTKN
jgi:type III secretory pathway component EscU